MKADRMGGVEGSRPADDPTSETDEGGRVRGRDRELPAAPTLLEPADRARRLSWDEVCRLVEGDPGDSREDVEAAVRQRIEEVGLTTETVPPADPRALRVFEKLHGEILRKHLADLDLGLAARHQQVYEQRLKSEQSEEEANDKVYMLIEVDGLPLGGIGLSRYDGPLRDEPPLKDHEVGEVVGVYTEPWARKNGVCTHGLRTVVDLARKRGFTALYLRVGPKQEDAIKRYEACGFTGDEALDYDPRVDEGLDVAIRASSPDHDRAIGMYMKVPGAA